MALTSAQLLLNMSMQSGPCSLTLQLLGPNVKYLYGLLPSLRTQLCHR